MNTSAHQHQRKARLALLVAALALAGGALTASADARGTQEACGVPLIPGPLGGAVPGGVGATPGALPPDLIIRNTCAGSGASSSASRNACTIVGTPGRDILTGTAGRDVICGRGGDDVLRGLGGDDLLRGGAGNDRLVGGDGNDHLQGGSGDDLLIALDGHFDLLEGDSGHDRAHADRLDTRMSVELG